LLILTVRFDNNNGFGIRSPTVRQAQA